MRKALGFTLVELMVAVLIIAIASAIAYPFYIDAVERGFGAKAVENLHCIRTALINFHADNSLYTANTAILVTYNRFDINDGNWQYTIVVVNNVGDHNFTITARRLVGRFINQTITLVQPYNLPPVITYPGGALRWPQ